MRRLLKTILEHNGAISIREARDGGEAIETARRCPPDLIVADWDMAPMTGLELVRYIRHSDKSPAPRAQLILLGGGSGGELRTMAVEAGAAEVIAKPLKAAILVEAIRRLHGED